MKYLLPLLLPLAAFAAEPAPAPWQPTPAQVQQGYQAAAYAEAQQLADAQATILILKNRVAELEQALAAAKAPPSATLPKK